MEYEIFVYFIQMWDNFMSNTLLCIILIVSNLDKKRLNKSDKKNLTLSEIQKETLIGVLLGDAHLSRPKPTHNTKLVFDQSNSLHKEYLLHLYDVFKSPGWGAPNPRVRGEPTRGL
jgi:LAGLIDADG DNA endonuclease family